MAIRDKTRKLLWGRSGNRCAICRLELTIDGNELDTSSLVGEECHIISGQVSGPRHDSTFPVDQLDSYENFLLLFRVHHKMVDDQCETYTSELLRQIKTNHEKWVKEKLTLTTEIKPPRFRRVKENVLPYLIRLTRGKDILNLVDGACAFSFDHDELKSSEEVELVGSFIQVARDWGDLGTDLEPIQKVQTGFELTETLQLLEEAGFYVFGGRENHQVESGIGPPQPWSVAFLRVIRKTNESIFSLDQNELLKPNSE